MRDASDPAGPEKAEKKGKARDGEEEKASANGNGNGGGSVADQAANGEPVPEAPPLKGDGQMTLAGLGRRGLPIESRASLLSASVPSEGLFPPDEEGQVLVAFRPAGYEYVPVRDSNDPNKVIRMKVVQKLRPIHIQRVSPELQKAIEAVNAEHEHEPTPV